MTEPQYQPGVCNETAGFLFAHPCGRVATRECSQCAKPICEQHLARGVGDGTLCITCGKAAPPAKHRRRRSGRYEDWEDDDPYFYSDDYYDDYYWGRDDYNESDEAVLNDSRSPDDMRGFENDMGAS